MPKEYLKMRDEFKKEGLSDKKAKSKAAAIYNSKHKEHPVGRYTEESTPYFDLLEAWWCGTGKMSGDQLPGGVDAKDIDAFLSRFEPDEVAKGIKVEMEHTDDPQLAKEIASDHLDEDPHYYTKLVNMEKKENKTPYFNSLQENLDAMASDHAQLAQRLRGQIEGASAWLQHVTKYQGKIEAARKKESEAKKKADQAKKKAEKKQAKAKKK